MTPPTEAMIARVRENLSQVQDRIAVAAQKAGRSASDVRLVGVSKYVGITETAALVAAGCHILGESRPQQVWEKATDSSISDHNLATDKKSRASGDEDRDLEWHLIGHLQRNKVDRTLPLVHLTHGVDSERLLKAINRSAEKTKKTASVLLEVNCAGDADKHGFAREDLADLVSRLGQYDSVQVKGLMTMAAREGGEAVARQNFSQLRKLRDRLSDRFKDDLPENVQFDELSMGMSGDFEEAIQEGSTLVRVGSALWQGIV